MPDLILRVPCPDDRLEEALRRDFLVVPVTDQEAGMLEAALHALEPFIRAATHGTENERNVANGQIVFIRKMFAAAARVGRMSDGDATPTPKRTLQ